MIYDKARSSVVSFFEVLGLPMTLDDHRPIVANQALDAQGLDQSARRSIMQAYEPSNEWVRANFFDTLPSLFPPLEARAHAVVDFSSGREMALELLRECNLA